MSGWESQSLPIESAITWDTSMGNALSTDLGPTVILQPPTGSFDCPRSESTKHLTDVSVRRGTTNVCSHPNLARDSAKISSIGPVAMFFLPGFFSVACCKSWVMALKRNVVSISKKKYLLEASVKKHSGKTPSRIGRYFSMPSKNCSSADYNTFWLSHNLWTPLTATVLHHCWMHHCVTWRRCCPCCWSALHQSRTCPPQASPSQDCWWRLSPTEKSGPGARAEQRRKWSSCLPKGLNPSVLHWQMQKDVDVEKADSAMRR